MLFITLALQIFRLLLIGVFQQQATHLTLDNLLEVMGMGLRFDFSTAALWAMPSFLLALGVTLLPVGRLVSTVRTIVAALFSLLLVWLGGADLIFFDEYNDQFTQQIFGLVDDDTTAILITIWKEYHPLLFLSLVLPLSWVTWRGIRRWQTWTPGWWQQWLQHPPVVTLRWLSAFGVMLLFVALSRGGLLWGEPMRLKHAFIVDDLFLNRTVVNPFRALQFAIDGYRAAHEGGGLATLWPSGNIREAAEVVAGRSALEKSGNDLDTLLSRTAPGPLGTRAPRHLFLILNESHSGWTVLPEYRWVGLSPEVAKLADRGIYFRHFLSAAYGTMPAVNTLFTGMPDAGLNINYEPRSMQHPYPSAIAAIFQKLGYRTRFFYGGPLSWQRIDAFAPSQGFDEVYGGGDISGKGVPTNEWGVADGYLFDFVSRHVDDATPSFNLILTTSNHPPYDLDLEGLGYPLAGKELPAPLQATKAETVKVLGHLWYSDQQIGRFVHETEQRLEAPLFAITGDHTSRLQVHFPDDNVAEQYLVPFVLYGPEILPQAAMPETAGSHTDITATLVELAAPAGFHYVAYGENLLTRPSSSYAQGYRFLIGEKSIVTDTQPPQRFRLPGQQVLAGADESALDAAIRYHHALRALSWYRVREGTSLPDAGAATAQ